MKIKQQSSSIQLQPAPANIMAERALLSAIIIDQSGETLKKASILTPFDFYDSQNRYIFSKMKEYYNSGKLIDLTDFVGTQYEGYVLDLMSLPDGLLNQEQYISKIKEDSAKRQIIKKLNEIQNKTYNKDIDFQEIKANILEFSKELSKNSMHKFEFKLPSQITAKKTTFLLRDFMPIAPGAVTMISAKGGSGKSALALQIVLRAANDNIKTFAWLSEDPDYTTKYRIEKISEFTKIPIKDNYISLYDEKPFQILVKKDKAININPLFYDFVSACNKFKIIILDPLIAFYGADENNNSEARQFMDILTEWAKKEDKAIILIHHQTKYMNVSIARGAGAFVDAVRAQYSIDKEKDDDRFIKIAIEKDNWGIKNFFGNNKLIQIFEKNYEKNETKTYYK